MPDESSGPSIAQVRQLLNEQLPGLAGEQVHRLDGPGTTNAIYRIGADHLGRFRKTHQPDSFNFLTSELRAMDEFRMASPFPSPRPVLLGEPGCDYPSHWSVLTWLPGEIADPHSHAANMGLAGDLAVLIHGLRRDPTGSRKFSGEGRGGDLTDHDEWIAHCIRESTGFLDTHAMAATWESLRSLPRQDPDLMCHTDLIPGNLIVTDGRLSAVLDTGGYGPADPALDLVCAWHLFDLSARETLREALDCTDLEWNRGKAWAFQQAAGLVWYYHQANPAMAELGRTTLSRILGEDH